MNCAHLENCLHEAREEARTNLCAADRRASEYIALRTSALRMHSLFERFRSCITAQVGVANFADTLRSLALSLARYSCDSKFILCLVLTLQLHVLSLNIQLIFANHQLKLVI